MPALDPSTPSVLIVDPSRETRLVVGELLGRSGVATVESGSAAGASLVIERAAVEVALIDGDSIDATELAVLAKLCRRKGTAIVVAGTNRPRLMSYGPMLFVRKPYHYRELVHKIWQALGASHAQARAAA